MLLSPHLSDKLVDWRLLEQAGGQALVIEKQILELGPSYGLDLMMWAPWAKHYTMLDSDPTVHAHLTPMIELFAGKRDVTLLRHNMQQPFAAALAPVDLVIDFGTVDNVLAGFLPYEESIKLLAPKGVLVTTYANRAFFQEDKSPSGDEQRFEPQQLVQLFTQNGCEVYIRMNEDQARAGMAVRKL